MTIYRRPVAVLDIDGDEYKVEGGTVTLDSSAVPYARAAVELPLLDDTTLDWLDPRDNVRCPLEVGDATGTPRPFNLGLRSRTVDHVAKTVTLSLASDEALLMDYAPLADDITPLGLAASLRAVVNYVLGVAIPGAALEAGSDANVTPLWDAVGLLGNPSFEGGSTAGLIGTTNVSGIILSGGAGFVGSGTASARYTSTAAGASLVRLGAAATTAKATPGRMYQFSIFHRSSIARSATMALDFYNSDGLIIKSAQFNFTSPAAADPLNSAIMQRFQMSAVAPPGTASVWPRVSTAGNTAGQFHYIDGMLLVESDFPMAYWDANFADTASYDYAWAGTANGTQSLRTALIDSPEPGALVWRAGQSAWDFLLTLTASVGMVLWCDEARDWWLKTPVSRTIATTISVSPANTRDGTDSLSRDDDDAFVTGVALVYTWTDSDGVARRAVDAAGTPEKVLMLELSQAYPGPGAAAAMLARRQGTGRVQDVTAASVYTATPGMTVQIALPGAPDTIGSLVSVRFDLADGFMDVGTSGLVDVIPGSIAALVGTINSLAGTINSL